MDAPQTLQRGIVETLHADGKARDTCVFKPLKLLFFKCAGVGFERDFGLRLQLYQRTHAVKQAVYRGRLKQAGRAAADKHGVNRTPPNVGQFAFFGQAVFGLVGIEVAIRAFAHAPRDMDIERQGRQGGKMAGAGKGDGGHGVGKICGRLLNGVLASQKLVSSRKLRFQMA